MGAPRRRRDRGEAEGLDDPALALPRPLPRGPASLPQELVLAAQRSRLVEAAGHVVAEKGYATATVADLIARAGVSRATFYALFRDKEDCFLFSFQKLAEGHLRAVAEAIEAAGGLPEQLLAAFAAYMDRAAVDRRFARAFLAEASAATPAVRDAFEARKREVDRVFRSWFARVRRRHPDVAPVPDALFELMLEGVAGFVVARARAEGDIPQPGDVAAMAAFCFGTLGLSGWARDALEGAGRFGRPVR